MYFLLIIIIIAILLRMFGSGLYEHPEFFSDELGRITTAKYMLNTGEPIIWNDFAGNPVLHFSHPPFDKLGYALFVSIAGDGYFVRLFPILAGIITILLVFYLGKTLYNRNVGIIAALLMAVSKYHIYGSQLIDVDGSFLPLFATATILMFVLYKKRSSMYNSTVAARKYLLLALLFFGLCIFTKLLAGIILVPIILYSIYYDREKRNFLTRNRKLIQKKHLIEIGYFIMVSVLVLLLILSIALSFNEIGWFDGPFRLIFTHGESTAEANLVNTLQNKAFFISTVIWQLTPFLAGLALLGLIFLKKNEKYVLLGSWVVFTLIFFLVPYRADVQRYFTMALPGLFVLVGAYIMQIYKQLEEKQFIRLAILSSIFFIVMAFLGVNDLMGYYEVGIVGLLFAMAAMIMFLPKKYSTPLLVSGFIGMSLFAVIGTNSWIGIGTYTVHELVGGVQEQGWDYREVWAWEDVIYQITPKDEILHSQRPELNMTFIEENNVKYIAIHTLQEEDEFREFSKNCRYSEFVIVNDHITGLLCELR